jgi:hypothetical protein
LIYALLKKAYETLSKVPPGATPPEPMLYDAAVHKAHRQGQYHTSKPKRVQEKMMMLPKN